MIKKWEVWARVELPAYKNMKSFVQCWHVKVEAEGLIEVDSKAMDAFKADHPFAISIDIYYADGRL